MAAALALLTALCYGVSNFVGPLLSRDLPTYAVLISGQVVALAVSLAIALAAGLPLPDTQACGAAAIAGIGNAGGLILFYRAAAIGPLSIVSPIGALSAIGPVVVGVAGGEGLGPLKLAGLVLALGGVALATRRSSAGGQGDVRGAAALALGAAGSFAFFLTFMRPASEEGIIWAVALSRVAVLAVMGGAAVAMSAPVRVPAGRLPSVAVPGVLLFAGTLTYSAATRTGDLSVVSVLVTLFPVVTICLAFAFLGERLTRTQGIGVAAALAGVVLISVHV